MRSVDALILALENLAEHKLRTALTTLGMMFGVGAVIAMLSIGAGAEREALALIERLGVDNVVVRAKNLEKEELAEIRKKSLGLSERDATAIREAVPNVELVLPKIEVEPYKIISATGKSEAKVFGVSHRHVGAAPIPIAAGRFLDSRDERMHAQVAVIGAGVRRDLFGTEAALGKRFKVNDLWLEVIGIIADEAAGESSVGGVAVAASDEAIYTPYTTALRKFRRDPLASPLSELIVRIGEGGGASEIGVIVGGLIRRLHADADDFEVIVPEALLRQSRDTQRLFSLVMGLIAGISLLVGGIGIMNIMLASVLEQTREIGVRRAVGARRGDIRYQFLVTSFTLSLLGGLAGVALGLAISRVVAAYADWPTVVTGASIALSLGVSVTVGIASGLYPAVRASRLDPIDALQAP